MTRRSQSKRRMPTIQDIARELGMSAMTVSRALNGHPDVKEATRQKVLALAEQKNYRANRWARSLVTRESQIIGIIIPDISHSFFSEITRGVQDTLEQHGYDLMLCHSGGDARRELRAIDTLVGSRVDGLIVASEQPEESAKIFLDLQQQGVAFVLVDRFFAGLESPRVIANDVEVGRLAAAHLIELGHRAIAHISGPAVSTGLLRLQGFRETLAEHGLEVREDWIVASDFRLEGGYRAMNALLASQPAPSAVFAGNDAAAVGAIQACRAAGLDVPKDISIVGAGRIEDPYHPNPFVTTIDWPRREMGRRAAKMLLRLVAGQDGPGRNEVIFEPTLLVRSSTAPPANR